MFRAGVYDSKPYSREFLQQVVDNFNTHQKQTNDTFPKPVAYFADANLARAIAPPTIGLGHEDDQSYLRWLLNRTDLPTAGRPTDLHMKGDSLMCSFADMPMPVAQLVNSGQLPTMSAEFYPDFCDEETGKSYGPMLRRISLLGGEIPKVKGLQTPLMVFSERKPLGRHSFRQVNTIVYFSEVGPTMDRAAILAALQACGMDTSTITDAVDDATLGALLKLAQQAKGAVSMAEPVNMPNGAAANSPAPTMLSEKDPVDKDIMQYAECGEDGMPKKMAEMPEMSGDKTKDKMEMAKFNERYRANMIALSKRPNAIVAPVLQELGLVRKEQKARSDADAQDRRIQERQAVVAFCEQMSREGRVAPVEIDDKDVNGKPKLSLIDHIMSMDHGQAIHTFGERRVTMRESFMETIKLRPATRHGRTNEQLGQPVNNTSTAAGAQGVSPLNKEQIRITMAATDSGRRALHLHDNGKLKIPALS